MCVLIFSTHLPIAIIPLSQVNNYIADVPMRFSEKFLSLQANDTLTEDFDGENFIKYKIDDVIFNLFFIILFCAYLCYYI